MHRRLRLKMLVFALLPLTGCASSSVRPLKWWRPKIAPSQLVQSSAQEVEGASAASFNPGPAKLPPGIELPPEQQHTSETQPAATQPDATPDQGSVIFAGFR